MSDPSAKDLASHIAALGDVNGDGFADFGVSGKTDSALGFVAVYLGAEDGGPDLGSPDVLVRGIQASSGSAYAGFCGAGNFDGDGVGAGDDRVEVDDIAVGEPTADRINVIPGRAEWTPGQTTVVIDVGAVDFTSSWSAQTYQADFGEPVMFGNKCTAAGDVLPTPNGGSAAHDLLVLQSGSDDARIFVVPGRAYEASGARMLTNLADVPSDEDTISVRLRQDYSPTLAYQSGFGTSIQGNVDLTGDEINDVLVAHAGRGTSDNDGRAVYVFDGQAIRGAQGGDLRVDAGDNAQVGGSWPGANGFIIEADPNSQFRAVSAVGDFDGWEWDGAATPDIAICNNGFDAVQLRVNHETAPGPEVLGLFPTHEAVITNPETDGMFSAGLWVGGDIDVDGDGWTDMLIGTGKGALVIVR